MDKKEYYIKNLRWCQNINCPLITNDYTSSDECKNINTQSTNYYTRNKKYEGIKYYTVYPYAIAIGRNAGHRDYCGQGYCTCYPSEVNTVELYKLHHHLCTSHDFCPGGVECYRNGSSKIKK